MKTFQAIVGCFCLLVATAQLIASGFKPSNACLANLIVGYGLLILSNQ